MPRINRRIVLRGAAAALIGLAGFASADPETAAGGNTDAERVARIRRDTERLASFPSRVVGTPGHDEASAWLLEQVRATPGAKVWTHAFPVVVPKVEKATLTLDGPLAGEHAVFPLWPDLGRLKTTAPEGISGKLIYVGEGEFDRIPVRDLPGNIVVMEMSAGARWRTLFSFGARAVLLLGSEADHRIPPQQQPVNFPRYYVPAGPLADALRAGRAGNGTIVCRASWAEARAVNVYALIRPERPVDGQKALAFLTAYDSMSTVLGQAPGADAALDTALLLDLMREAAGRKPARPLLFCFTDAFGFDQLGVRQAMAVVGCLPDQRIWKDYEREHKTTAEDYREILDLLTDIGDGEAALGRLPERIFKPLHGLVKDEISPPLLELEDVLSDLRLERSALDLAGTPDPALDERIREMTLRRADLNAMQYQLLSRESLSPRLMPEALTIMERIRGRARRQMEDHERLMGVFDGWNGLRHELLSALGVANTNDSPVSFVMGLDLSDAASTVGPALFCAHLRSSGLLIAEGFLRWLAVKERSGEPAIWDEAAKPYVNFKAALDRGENPISFNIGEVATLTSPAGSFGLSAMTWATLGGVRLRVDTPQDRADRLDWQRLEPQIRATRQLVEHMAHAPGFALADSSPVQPAWRQVHGRIVDVAIGAPVPRVPCEGYLVTLAGTPGVAGVRRNMFAITGADGLFHFEPMAAARSGSTEAMRLEAFRLDEDGNIVRAVVSAGAAGGGPAFRLNAPLIKPLRAVIFKCRELEVPELFDPRFLEPLGDGGNFTFMDAVRGGPPKRANVTIQGGCVSALIEPKTRWQLILRAGASGNRMALVGMDEGLTTGKMTPREAMKGFDPADPLSHIPHYLSATDFHRLDAWRLEHYRRAGVTIELTEQAHRRTGDLIREADRERAENDALGYWRASIQALAGELRAYQSIRTVGDDVARGAIFLLLLLLPFSVATERLLFACVGIAGRVVSVLAIFVGMTGVLWSFHPAFRVSGQPVVIVLAFAVLALSCVVISVVMQRFEKDLEEIRRGRAEASGAQTARGGIVGSAVWLGIANMRKRPIRTALTSITVMLVTFALLCFSSASSYSAGREFRIDDRTDAPPHVLIREPSMTRLPSIAVETVASILGGKTNLAIRSWWAMPPAYAVGWDSTPWRIHLRNPATHKEFSVKAALGLEPNEGTAESLKDLFPDWDRFAEGAGVYLSGKTAETLGVPVGGDLEIGGRRVRLLGVFEALEAEKRLTMLDGLSLLPLDFSMLREGHDAGRGMNMSTAEAGAAGIVEKVEPDMTLPHVTGDEVIVVPGRLCRELGGDLRSLAVSAASHEEARQTARTLSETLAFPIYFGAADGVRVIVSTPILPRAARKLLIPLIIASLIIFNTMLSSVAERKGEIHIYTSLGLAPGHVAVLFIAEAVTYGLLGSIFGYVGGQGLATLFSHFGWLGGLTLNYSGTQVVMTMVLVLLVVVLSAIFPATMAARMAVPSKDMRWRLPDPVDGVIADALPFTVTARAANGLMLFIHEYFEAHRDGAIGHFTADRLQLSPISAAGTTFLKLESVIWLAPYDLGVRQEVEIFVEPVDGDVCEVRIRLRYGSGDERNWRKLNMVFVGDLRRQLLGWRKLSRERIVAYLEQATERMDTRITDGAAVG